MLKRKKEAAMFCFCFCLTWEEKLCGLAWRYRREKWTSTRSRSELSPVNWKACRNRRRATSSVAPSKSKCFKYSSATVRLKSLFLDRWRDTSDFWNPSRAYKLLRTNQNTLINSCLISEFHSQKERDKIIQKRNAIERNETICTV